MTAASGGQDQNLEAESFKKLYPEQYYSRFIASGVRPDGRPLGRARPVTIGINAIGTADASALVKIGSTSVLAGIKLEVLTRADEPPKQGEIATSVEMTPMSSSEARPGRTSDTALCIAEQVGTLLRSAKAVDLSRLTIGAAKAAWMVYLDIYVLDADGSLQDACLLAAVAALASLRLPKVAVNEHGKVTETMEGKGDLVLLEAGATAVDGLLGLQEMPLSLTCGMFEGKVIVDLTAEEEALTESTVTTTVDGRGRLIGLYKPGGQAEAETARLQDCIEAAKLRYKQVTELLVQSLAS